MRAIEERKRSTQLPAIDPHAAHLPDPGFAYGCLALIFSIVSLLLVLWALAGHRL